MPLYKREMVKPLTILIPNATGPSNPGDQAILKSLLALLRSSFPPSTDITIHSSDPHLYKKEKRIKIKPTLYMWAGFQNRNPIIRMIRLSRLFVSYVTTKLGFSIVISKELRNVLNDYKQTDIFVFVGGGYLRSQKGLTQSLNLLMVLSMFQFAKLYKRKKIVMPMSFGPFAYRWQERLAAQALKGFDCVSLREKHSYKLLKKYRIKNLFLSSDLALLQKPPQKNNAHKKQDFVIGFTIRKWLAKKKQKRLEEAFFLSLKTFCNNTNAVVQPIAQIDNNAYGDKDKDIANTIASMLVKEGIAVLPMRIVKNYPRDISVYDEIDLLLGMRMHSLIFATLYNTPFVAVSYEYKTDGFVDSMGLRDVCIPCTNVTEKNLTKLLFLVYKNRIQIQKTLDASLQRIRERENKKWREVFSRITP